MAFSSTPEGVIIPETENPSKIGVHGFIWECDFNFHSNLLQSPTFSSNGSFKWYLQIYPKGFDVKSGYVSLFLFSCHKSIVKAKYSFSILTAKKEEYKQEDHVVRTFKEANPSWGFNKWIKLDLLPNYIRDGKLKILCRIHTLVDKPFKAPDCRISDEYVALFEKREFTDVIILVNSREIPAHKAVLAARSPVFRSMLAQPMKQIEIEDIEEGVVEEMLRFIYSGQAPNINRMADGLLAAAEKFGLERLKMLCEEVMCDFLSVNNAAQTLILADLYCAVHLKAFAIDFITTHATEVMDSVGWKTKFSSHSSRVAVETFRALAIRKSQ